MLITKTSSYSGKENTLEINVLEQQLQDYNNGCHPLIAFKGLKEEEIEFLISGVPSDEWQQMMNDECKNL
jgi:hypothetical protein